MIVRQSFEEGLAGPLCFNFRLSVAEQVDLAIGTLFHDFLKVASTSNTLGASASLKLGYSCYWTEH